VMYRCMLWPKKKTACRQLGDRRTLQINKLR